MKHYVMGLLSGIVLAISVSAGGAADDRSPQQRKYDYYRERQQQLDIEHLRRNLDRQDAERRYRKQPC